MKRSISIVVSVLALTLMVMAFDCGGTDPPPRPTPVPPTATPITTPTPGPEPVPELVPPLPKVIGFTQVGDMADPLDYDIYNLQSNEETADQIIFNGFQAVALFPHELVRGEDVGAVVCNPQIKLITIRPQARISWDSFNCADVEYNSTVWENADFGQIAYDLLKQYGDLSCRGGEPLDIILNNWEADWQAKGTACRLPTPTAYREYRTFHMYETQQMGVEWAREQFPNAQLRVLHGLVTNHRIDDKYQWTVTRDMIPKMAHPPDLIGLSYYGDGGDETPAQAIETTQRHTGYPISRMYFEEFGWSENWDGRQAARYELVLPAMAATGVRSIFIWTWKQYTPGQFKPDGSRSNGWFGVWEVNPEETGDPTHDSFTGRWTSGLIYASDFRLTFDDNPLPAVTPPPGGPPLPTYTPIPPTVTPTPPPGDCDHCPDPSSMECTLNWPACVQCWEECGQPIATPTPAPPTHTPTATVPPGSTPTVTPTPVPEDCDHCPLPGSFECTINYPLCVQCWEECGEPLPTPTPAATKTPTPTPTPVGDPANPTFTAITEGSPTNCAWRISHAASGTVIYKNKPLCTEFNFSFPEAGWWRIQLTTHYAHGATGIVTEDNGDKHGDLDGDGLYEYRHIQEIEVALAPAAPIIL